VYIFCIAVGHSRSGEAKDKGEKNVKEKTSKKHIHYKRHLTVYQQKKNAFETMHISISLVSFIHPLQQLNENMRLNFSPRSNFIHSPG